MNKENAPYSGGIFFYISNKEYKLFPIFDFVINS